MGFFAHCDLVGPVDVQSYDGCSADRRYSCDDKIVPGKVLVPVVLAGIKQSNKLFGLGIDAGDIWTLAAITVAA